MSRPDWSGTTGSDRREAHGRLGAGVLTFAGLSSLALGSSWQWLAFLPELMRLGTGT